MPVSRKSADADYVIIGAGSGGCVLAHRLSAESARAVVLLEAGRRDNDLWISIPFAWGKMLRERRNDWGYNTEPEPYLANRIMDVPRGKVLGGSSSTNAMAYVRGHTRDYDRWAAAVSADWSYARVLPYFRRSEQWEGGSDAWRGGDGPLSVIRARSTDPLHEAYRESVQQMGVCWTDDYNGVQSEGIGTAQHTIRNGRRESAATAFLRPALERKNLKLVTRALATRILVEHGRATGVVYERDGVERVIRAGRAVVLAAGAVNSPHLLMLSGIGPAKALRQHGIEVLVNLPGVGANLQDHLAAGIVVARKTPGPLVSQMRADRAAFNVLRAYAFGTGPMSMLPTRYQAFVRATDGLDAPDIQLLAGGATLAARLWFPGVRAPYADAFACAAAGLHPKSRGSIELVSADPKTLPRIRQNFLADPGDLTTLRRGLRFVRDIVRQTPFDPMRGAEMAPGADIVDDAGLDAYIRSAARSVQHPAGTCRMGIDDGAVVDPRLRVIGVDGLYVADASVMPDLVGGNINAAVIMIAERASDIILERETPAAATQPLSFQGELSHVT